MEDHIRFYLVGGCVRDEILGHTPNDIDYSVEAESFEHLKRHLSSNNFEIYIEKPEFGTLKAKCPDTNIVADYSLCRKDGVYSDLRRPDSIELTDIKNDLSRRDFTINAIAKLKHDNGEMEYYDPFNGMEDIEKKFIQCVGSTHSRLSEDPLRGLRALRFSVTKGFDIHHEIIETLSTNEFIENFKTLAKERIQIELTKMFKHDTVESIKLLSGLDPELLNALFANNIWLLPTFKNKKIRIQ
jgi:tRNA nucleotidyltransferase (CCA-adding enzyme)